MTTSAQRKKSVRNPPRRRRILLLAGASYASAGRTVQDDLAEARLAIAKRLLSDRRIPVCDIPGRVGFESPGHFMQFFKARTGMTMLQWRRRGGRAFPP